MGTDPMLCVAFSANKQVCCAIKLLANHFVSLPVLFVSPYAWYGLRKCSELPCASSKHKS